MATSDYGRNRLATGFDLRLIQRRNSKSSGEISDGPREGESPQTPIEISDDDLEESEGGIVINIDHESPVNEDVVSQHSNSAESGEITLTQHNTPKIEADESHLFSVDMTPTKPSKRLIDLPAEELEDQLKYAFYHIDRNQVDLQRAAVCLTCYAEGHVHNDCSQTSSGRVPLRKIESNVPLRLWVSCCVCASKSHLVGDCPELDSSDNLRWSLKVVSPEQIVNMSLETGTKKLEKEAENRGIRPPGLQIKGRANIHHPGGKRRFEESEDDTDEPFIRRPVASSRPTDRYDRFEPPSDTRPYRGGGQWYATDSFGRQRSRSPDDRYIYRPRENESRSAISAQRDNWRPSDSDNARVNHQSRRPPPPRRKKADSTTTRNAGRPNPEAGPHIRIQLPMRKGSGGWSQIPGQSGTSTPTSNGPGGGGHHSKKNKNKSGNNAGRKG